MKERDVLLSASLEHTLRIWNLDTFECIWISNDVKFGMINNIIQLINDRVIIEGGDKEIIIVNIDKCNIEKKVFSIQFNEHFLYSIKPVLLLDKEKQIVLCKCDEELFLILNLKEQTTKIIKYQVDNQKDKLFFDNEGNIVSFISETLSNNTHFKSSIKSKLEILNDRIILFYIKFNQNIFLIICI